MKKAVFLPILYVGNELFNTLKSYCKTDSANPI
jgi:hypothetical protein